MDYSLSLQLRNKYVGLLGPIPAYCLYNSCRVDLYFYQSQLYRQTYIFRPIITLLSLMNNYIILNFCFFIKFNFLWPMHVLYCTVVYYGAIGAEAAMNYLFYFSKCLSLPPWTLSMWKMNKVIDINNKTVETLFFQCFINHHYIIIYFISQNDFL